MLVGLCEELEALAGCNVLRVLNFKFTVDGCESKTWLKDAFERLEEVLMSTGWSALKRVFVEIRLGCCSRQGERLHLESLPELYLSRLSSWGILVYKSLV
jgi:hypothetical protein